MKYYCLITLMVFTIFSGFSQKKAQEPTSTIEELTSQIQTVFDNSPLPGFSLIVVDNQKVVYQQSMGYADIATKTVFTNHTVQNIASVSKTFIGVALMKAAEQGKIDLDTDINEYIPFKVTHPLYQEAPITLRHLATHTSGINDEKTYSKSYVLKNPNNDYSYLPKKIRKYISMMRENSKIDDSEFLKNVLQVTGKWYSQKNFTKKKPGNQYRYSNIGAALAAFVLESAVGMTYEEYTHKYIFKPLQMNESNWVISDLDKNQFVTRYFRKDMLAPDYELVTKADGALITSTTDFGKYLIEMLKGYNGEGMLLSANSYNTMFDRKEFGKESSGIFWGVSPSGKPNHSGSDPGVLTNTAINPEKNLAVFFMTNMGIELNKDAFKALIAIRNILKEHNW